MTIKSDRVSEIVEILNTGRLWSDYSLVLLVLLWRLQVIGCAVAGSCWQGPWSISGWWWQKGVLWWQGGVQGSTTVCWRASSSRNRHKWISMAVCCSLSSDFLPRIYSRCYYLVCLRQLLEYLSINCRLPESHWFSILIPNQEEKIRFLCGFFWEENLILLIKGINFTDIFPHQFMIFIGANHSPMRIYLGIFSIHLFI